MSSHFMQPAKPQTVTAITTDRLRQLILNGDLGVGEPLRQDELSARLGVSRTPLREAIITLQAEGLVINQPHRGAVVYKPTRAELEEIYEIRILLESHAAYHAALAITAEQLVEVEKIVQSMDESDRRADLINLNRQFRELFYSASGKIHLLEIIRSLTRRAEPYVNLLIGATKRPFHRNQFSDLLGALRKRDAERAADITRSHLKATVEAVLPLLKN
ncbi:GntR family transcriptional regulator [Pusillimonas sp.]|uniref:GntR family transcriptional regulator n=1 Tax=Pusillimonas sp. TaxID=3040095 RepID=UPI0037C7CFC7